MKRRSLIVALSVISALAVLPSGAAAATAPAAAPVLTSAPFATLVSFSWTPGNGLNTSQSVFRSDGPCATPVSSGQIQPGSPYAGNTTAGYIANVADGVYCYYVQAADLALDGQQPGPDGDRRHARPGGDHRHPERVGGGRRQRHGLHLLHERRCRLGRRHERAAHRRDRSLPVGSGHGFHLGHDGRRQRSLRRLQRRRRQCGPRRRRHDHRDGGECPACTARRAAGRARGRQEGVRASRRSSPPRSRSRSPVRRRRA